MIILHKIGSNQDHTSPKNYWPTSLFNILGKIIKTIQAIKISYIVITYNLLSKTYFMG